MRALCCSRVPPDCHLLRVEGFEIQTLDTLTPFQVINGDGPCTTPPPGLHVGESKQRKIAPSSAGTALPQDCSLILCSAHRDWLTNGKNGFVETGWALAFSNPAIITDGGPLSTPANPRVTSCPAIRSAAEGCWSSAVPREPRERPE
jgi:hypothetical protein